MLEEKQRKAERDAAPGKRPVTVSNPQTPVLWAASAIDITSDIVKLYDQANPGTGAAPTGAAPAARPSTPTSAPPPAPKKK